MIRKAENSDKLAIYNLYNTMKSDASSFIDYFFNEFFDHREYYLLIVNEVVLALVRVKDEILHFKNYNLEVNIINEFLVAENCPSDMLREFLETVFASFKYQKLITLAKSEYDLKDYGFKSISKFKRYKLNRSDLFFVNDYYVFDEFNVNELRSLYNQFTKHFESYLFRSESYFSDYLKLLKALNYEIYVSKSKNGQLLGYIVYNYIEGEIQVIELVYLDSIALITLLNQAMGINNYIYINTSNSEVLSKIFKDIAYQIYPNLSFRVNDKDLFGRLFSDVDVDKAVVVSDYLQYK